MLSSHPFPRVGTSSSRVATSPLPRRDVRARVTSRQAAVRTAGACWRVSEHVGPRPAVPADRRTPPERGSASGHWRMPQQTAGDGRAIGNRVRSRRCRPAQSGDLERRERRQESGGQAGIVSDYSSVEMIHWSLMRTVTWLCGYTVVSVSATADVHLPAVFELWTGNDKTDYGGWNNQQIL